MLKICRLNSQHTWGHLYDDWIRKKNIHMDNDQDIQNISPKIYKQEWLHARIRYLASHTNCIFHILEAFGTK